MIRVVKPGLWSSIQDSGRYGFRALGVPVSGAMDAHSAALANEVLGNPVDTAVLEFTAMGPELLFKVDAYIVVAGANFGIHLNGEAKPLNKPIAIPSGATLKFSPPTTGWRGYLAIKGGFVSETILGSKSMYQGITFNVRIKKGDVLKINAPSEILTPNKSSLKPLQFDSKIINVFKGPEYDFLAVKLKHELENLTFKINQNSNRMAIQIDGLEEVKINAIFTAPVQPGTVQITPSGKLLILMKDAQTTGGYPRIFQLTKEAVCVLSQKRPNEDILFRVID